MLVVTNIILQKLKRNDAIIRKYRNHHFQHIAIVHKASVTPLIIFLSVGNVAVVKTLCHFFQHFGQHVKLQTKGIFLSIICVFNVRFLKNTKSVSLQVPMYYFCLILFRIKFLRYIKVEKKIQKRNKNNWRKLLLEIQIIIILLTLF